MNNDLTFWQKLVASLGEPNADGSNYTWPEKQYFFRKELAKYPNIAIPESVIDDAWKGANIAEATSYNGYGNYRSAKDYFKNALKKRVDLRNTPEAGMEFSPTGADIFELWNQPLQPKKPQVDAIMRSVLSGE